MFLKELNIKGFKSFLNNTKMSFYKGVTAIVGPNGSGKSNISDAIRWALGETSVKNLRGSKMEDVIFTGTDNHKPVGFAEVEITFDDCNIPTLPYDEVTVTRRMYRDGESEYYLNKNRVRLKDIREAFMDTGIGRDGYSLIGQGQIDEVLSSKPEERRFIFEEASGISKFRFKKEEAISKIKKCEEDIVRLRDILSEINAQYNRLEKESTKAKEYTKLAIVRNDLKLDFLYLNLSKNISDRAQIIKNLDMFKSDLLKMNSEIKLKLNKESALEESIEKYNRSYDEINKEKLSAIKNFTDVKTEYRLNQERAELYKKELVVLESRVENYQEEIKSLGEKIELLLVNSNADENENQEEIKKVLEDKILKLDELERKYTMIRNQAMKNMVDYSKLESELKISVQKKQMIESRLEEVAKEKEDFNIKLSDLKLKTEDIKLKIEKIEQEKKELEEKRVEINQQLAEKKNSYETLKKAIVELEAELKLVQYKRDLKDNLLKQNELSNYTNKSVFHKFKNSDGYLGDFYKNIDVEKKYIKAVEIGLGQKLNYIMTKNENDAKDMVNYLKEEKAGRATFLPLDNYNKPAKWPQLQSNHNLLGYLSDFIETKSEYRNLVDSLVGPIVLYRNMESALVDRKKIGKTIVTLEGELLHFSGSITGGEKAKSQTTPLGVKNEIIELNQKIKKMEAELRDKQSKIKEMHSEELEETIKELDRKLALHTKVLLELNEAYIINQERIETIETNLKNADEVQKQCKSELLKVNIVDYDTEEYSNAQAELEGFEKIYKKDKTILLEEIAKLRERLKNIEIHHYEKMAASNQLKECKERKVSLKINLEESKQKYKSINDELALVKKNNELVIHKMKAEEQKEKNFDTQINHIISSRDEIREEIRVLRKEKEKLGASVSEIEVKINLSDVKIARIDENISLNKEKLLSEFNVSLEEFIANKRQTKNIREVTQELNDVTTQIENMGHVNLSALSQFEECKERKDFYEKQIEDINSSILDLQAIVDEINRDMRRQFKTSFDLIRKNFKEVFETLFNGGYADLSLADENDVLETGINIVAKPPGKKEQALSLLSGGEKTLTAMALLFAFLKLKPSPFCILDEIDAALDDANIRRYTKFLSELSQESQFLVITHRKTTLEVADTIYGVCMPNKGVSEIISMKFDDYEEVES